MRIIGSCALAVLLPALVLAQATRPDAKLYVTVLDPSGAVIVGAHITLQPSAVATGRLSLESLDTGGRGEAVFSSLTPGRYTIRVEASGFEPYDARDVRVRAGDNRREIKVKIARLAETVNVTRDPSTRASDARGDAFATILGQTEINELPDDPDEMERVLNEMAGPGAALRVNGFRGGKLPPKDQIQQIRFRRSMFAADTHEPGHVFIDITTKPGLDAWRGSTSAGLRDAALNSRNAFAPVKGDERNQRYGLSLNGPLWPRHTSLALSLDGLSAFDTRTIVAALPSGFFADSIRKPSDAVNVSARLEHALSTSQILRAEVQRNHAFADNLGVGDFDLPERGSGQTRNEDLFRVSTSGSIRKSMFNELRLQWRTQSTSVVERSSAAAVLVLNAFNAGGAQLSGVLNATETEIADDLDIVIGKHSLRTGFLVEVGRYRDDQLRNGTGTFTFSSLAAYSAGRPTTFTRNVGNPLVEASQVQSGVYVQDDIRVHKALTLSAGIRQEIQSHIGGLHVSPRGGLTWSPFKSGKTTVRAGGGVFYDWFDAQTFEQALQLDGTHQEILTIAQPGYPDPSSGGTAVVLPPGRVQLAPGLGQPESREAIAGIEQQLGADARVSATYIRRRGLHQLRGVNINAPGPDGRRPDPGAGPITSIESIAQSWFDALSLNLNWTKAVGNGGPGQRIFVAANYLFSRSINETDGPFSLPADSFNLAAERGPSLTDARHRFTSLANVPLPWHLRLGTSLRLQSALPYNITTGHDDNGDTISNDRPPGVTRNTGRGHAQVDLGARMSWTTGFGQRASGGATGPQVRIVRGGDSDPLGSMSMPGPGSKRYGLEIYAQAYNLTNHVNALNFSGVQTSPFFGQPTSAAPPRRVQVGVRLSF